MAKENTLIYRAQTGDERAFADLMRSYHAFVYAIVIGIVDNSHDAEEVVQDAFLNAYQGLRQLEDTTKFKSWLAEITRNCVRQWLRKQRGETVSLDEVSEEMLQTEDFPDERFGTTGTERADSPHNGDASAERRRHRPRLLSGGCELRRTDQHAWAVHTTQLHFGFSVSSGNSPNGCDIF